MLRYLCVLFFFLPSCMAADVTFEWDYVVGEVTPSGFELRIAQTPGGSPVKTQDCPGASTRQCTIPVDKGQWYATAYAYATDDAGKRYSGPSNEVAFQISGSPSSPVKVRIRK